MILRVIAAGYIALTTAVHEDSIFLAEIKECSKRIYDMKKFVKNLKKDVDKYIS